MTLYVVVLFNVLEILLFGQTLSAFGRSAKYRNQLEITKDQLREWVRKQYRLNRTNSTIDNDDNEERNP